MVSKTAFGLYTFKKLRAARLHPFSDQETAAVVEPRSTIHVGKHGTAGAT